MVNGNGTTVSQGNGITRAFEVQLPLAEAAVRQQATGDVASGERAAREGATAQRAPFREGASAHSSSFAVRWLQSTGVHLDPEHERYAPEILEGLAWHAVEHDGEQVVLCFDDGLETRQVTILPEHTQYLPEILEGFAALSRKSKLHRDALAELAETQRATELPRRPASPQQSASPEPARQPRRKSTRSKLELPPSSAFIKLFKTILAAKSRFEQCKQLVRKAARAGLLKHGEQRYLLSKIDALQSMRRTQTAIRFEQLQAQPAAARNGAERKRKKRSPLDSRESFESKRAFDSRDGFAKTFSAPRKGEPVALVQERTLIFSQQRVCTPYGLPATVPALTRVINNRLVVRR